VDCNSSNFLASRNGTRFLGVALQREVSYTDSRALCSMFLDSQLRNFEVDARPATVPAELTLLFSLVPAQAYVCLFLCNQNITVYWSQKETNWRNSEYFSVSHSADFISVHAPVPRLLRGL
jgi:hypothetical protein